MRYYGLEFCIIHFQICKSTLHYFNLVNCKKYIESADRNRSNLIDLVTRSEHLKMSIEKRKSNGDHSDLQQEFAGNQVHLSPQVLMNATLSSAKSSVASINTLVDGSAGYSHEQNRNPYFYGMQYQMPYAHQYSASSSSLNTLLSHYEPRSYSRKCPIDLSNHSSVYPVPSIQAALLPDIRNRSDYLRPSSTRDTDRSYSCAWTHRPEETRSWNQIVYINSSAPIVTRFSAGLRRWRLTSTLILARSRLFAK